MAFNQPSTNDQQRQFDAFKEWMLDFFCENEGVGTTNHSDSNATSTAQANVRTKAEEPLLPVHSFMSGDTALPSEDPNPDDIEKLLAKDMEAMKFEERELMYESIHGVDPIVKETPELILEKLAEMDKEVKKQMATQPGLSKNHAYNKAKEIEPGYVQGLRLMFLRVDRFVASKAAKRMLGFFEAKLELFGPDALARPLYLSDFDKHDMAYMRGGHFQLLPFRDRSGRAICCDFGDPNHTIYHSFNNLVRTTQSKFFRVFVLFAQLIRLSICCGRDATSARCLTTTNGSKSLMISLFCPHLVLLLRAVKNLVLYYVCCCRIRRDSNPRHSLYFIYVGTAKFTNPKQGKVL